MKKKSKIFNGASSCNQFRFHSGYHYPRSQKTVNEINKSKKIFLIFLVKKYLKTLLIITQLQKKAK